MAVLEACRVLCSVFLGTGQGRTMPRLLKTSDNVAIEYITKITQSNEVRPHQRSGDGSCDGPSREKQEDGVNTWMTETAWSLLQSWRSHISHKCWFAGKTLPSQGSTCKLLAEHYLAQTSMVAQLVKNSPAMQDTWV